MKIPIFGINYIIKYNKALKRIKELEEELERTQHHAVFWKEKALIFTKHHHGK